MKSEFGRIPIFCGFRYPLLALPCAAVFVQHLATAFRYPLLALPCAVAVAVTPPQQCQQHGGARGAPNSVNPSPVLFANVQRIAVRPTSFNATAG